MNNTSLVNASFDVVVAGGGLAGTFAAIEAARLGSKTALIQDRSVLGGNTSSELYVGISGADCSGGSLARYARETGLIGEFALELLRRSCDFAGGVPLHSVILWEMVKREPNLSLYLNTSLRAALTDNSGAITAVRACQISNEREHTFSGKFFIDCTGHGTLGALAGAEFRMGREARSEFGESMAPEITDSRTMGASLIFKARDMGRPVPFVAPDWAARFPTDESLSFRHPSLEKVDRDGDEMCGFWWIEYGGQRHTIDDAEEIHDELIRIVFGVWDHMKNTGDHGVANYAITQITPAPAQRESRRLIGDYLMTENDVRSMTLFPDRVAYGGWPIDIHPPEGIYSKDPPCTHEYLSDLCSIPFRSLYSRNVPNLLFAGRDISVTHVALGTVRVMATCAVMGQAVGTAAALCCRYDLSPRQLGLKRIRELQQQLLRDDCYLVGLSNEDPEDLAHGAIVTATSEAALDLSCADEWHEVAVPCAQMFPVSADRIETVELFLRSALDKPAAVRLGLRAADTINDFGSEDDLAVADGMIRPGDAEWVSFHFNTQIEPGRFYWVYLASVDGVAWAVQHYPPHGTNRAVYDVNVTPPWRSVSPGRSHGKRGAFVLRVTPSSRPYGPMNVVSGVNRPERETNLWISDPRQPLPQTLELTLPQFVTISQIQLIFDDDLDNNIYLPRPWGCLGQGMRPSLVRAYRLLAKVGETWRELAVIENNHQRRRVHAFAAVRTNQVRVECLATHGVSEARVYEVRIYEKSCNCG